MVQIHPEQPSFSQLLGRNIGAGLGSAIGGIPEALKGKKKREESDIAIERLTGKNVKGLSPELQKLYLEKFARSPEHEKITQALINQGIPAEEAELYSYLTQGGQTAFVKDYLDQKKRERSGKDLPTDEIEFPDEEISPEVSSEKPAKNIRADFKKYVAEKDKGLTPAEIVVRGKERYSTGLKEYQEAGTKLRGLSRDKERIDILQDLDKSKKLPKNLGRLNVDKEGNLRISFLASKEAQRYVKTLNEFSSGAKDTFGARVTNFDLAQYLRRFPTLLNSEEGRRELYEQMRIVNQINAVYYKNLKNVYDQAGGVRGIDSDVAERFAEQLSDPQINKLTAKFKDIGKTTSLPNPAEFEGKRIRDTETGEILISDGQNWVPAG